MDEETCIQQMQNIMRLFPEAALFDFGVLLSSNGGYHFAMKSMKDGEGFYYIDFWLILPLYPSIRFGPKVQLLQIDFELKYGRHNACTLQYSVLPNGALSFYLSGTPETFWDLADGAALYTPKMVLKHKKKMEYSAVKATRMLERLEAETSL